VNYRLGPGVDEPSAVPGIFVFGAGGFEKPIEVKKVAAGAFRGRLQIGARQGLFRVRPVIESRAFPEVGYYRQEQELLDYGSNQFLLRSISDYTGGRFNPGPKQVFDAAGRSESSSLRLWPGLLGFAIALNLAELIMRKGRAVLDSFSRVA